MEKRELAVKLTETMLVITVMFMAYGTVPAQVRTFAALCWIIFALSFGFVEVYKVKTPYERTLAKIKKHRRKKKLRKIGRFFLIIIDPTKPWTPLIAVVLSVIPGQVVIQLTGSFALGLFTVFVALSIMYLAARATFKKLY